MAESFPEFSKEQTDGLVVEGRTLRARLKQERKQITGKGRLSRKLLAELRKKYALPDALSSQLIVDDATETVDDVLMGALATAANPNVARRAKGPLVTYIQTCAGLNQRELCGIMKFLATCPVAASTSKRGVVISCLLAFVSRGFHIQYAKEFDIMKSHFDKALAHTWLAEKKAGTKITDFWARMQHCVVVLGGTVRQDIDDVVAETRAWLNVRAQIDRAVAASVLGEKMFGHALKSVTEAEFSDRVRERAKALQDSAPITVAKLVALKDPLGHAYHVIFFEKKNLPLPGMEWCPLSQTSPHCLWLPPFFETKTKGNKSSRKSTMLLEGVQLRGFCLCNCLWECPVRIPCRQEELMKLAKQSQLASSHARRCVMVEYRGKAFECTVGSVQEEIEMHLNAALKSMAVAVDDALPSLSWESPFAAANTFVPGMVDNAVLEPFKKVRRQCEQFLDQCVCYSLGDVWTILGRKLPDLLITNPSFAIEFSYLGWLKLSGAEKRMQSLVLQGLPSKTKRVSIEEALMTVQGVKAGPIAS